MQAKHKSLKQRFIAIFTILALVATALSVFAFAPIGRAGAVGLDEDVFTRDSSGISVTNGDFASTSSSSSDNIADPSSWNAETNSSQDESVVHGVVDLDVKSFLDEDKLKEYKLDERDEFKDVSGNFGGRLTPFGENGKFPGTNSKALFINSNAARVFYGYNSATLSLSSNSYYEISAWVKTSDFGSNEGATVKLTGLKNPLSFGNINTVAMNGVAENGEANNYGWVKYSFYIETSSMMTSTVSVALELGNCTEYTADSGKTITDVATAQGYVFFDNVNAAELSRSQFIKEVSEKAISVKKSFDHPLKSEETRTYSTDKAGVSMLYSENDSALLSIGDDGALLSLDDEDYFTHEVGSFSNDSKGWTQLDGSQGGSMIVDNFNGPSEELGIIDMRPFSPDGDNDKIAVLSNYRQKEEKYNSSVIGYGTANFTVPMMTNYRLSVWVNACNGSVASAALYGEDYRGPITSGVNAGRPQKRVTSDMVGGDANDDSHNGWREIVFYLKGSYYTDYSVRMEIWLGRRTLNDNNEFESENASGVAMFDNIRIEKITDSEFTSYSNSSTSYVYDYAEGTNDIANHGFDGIEEGYTEGTLPAPSDWTIMTAGEDGTTGMSSNVVDESYKDKVHTGVISSDAKEYTVVRPSDNDKVSITKSINTNYPDGEHSRLLMIRSDKETGNNDGITVGYKSSTFSVAADNVRRIDVSLYAADIEGQGVNIILKNGSNILAAIEGIKSTGGYKTYSIYFDSYGKTFGDLRLEIWLGLYDKQLNQSKLASGTVFVDKAEIVDASDIVVADNETATRQAIADKLAEYESIMDNTDSPAEFAVFSASDTGFGMFDRYDDSFLKTPYNWQLSTSTSEASDAISYGIFNGATTALYGDSTSFFPDGYKQGKIVNDDSTLGDANNYSLAIFNKSPAMSRITSRYAYRLDSASYYTVTVYAKVDIPAAQKADRLDYKGAFIGIDGTDYFCSDIRSTASVTDFYAPETDDNDNFRKFTIHIHTAGEADSTDITSINLSFGIGGSARGERAVGSLIINSVSVTKDNDAGTSFESAKQALENGSALSRKFTVVADYTAADEGDGGENPDEGEGDEPASATGNNWYIYMTIILAVVVVIAIAAVGVRYFANKRKKDGSDPNVKVSYDRSKTLAKQVKAREQIGGIEEFLGSYDRFDEDEEDKFAAMKEEEELKALEAAEKAEGAEESAEEEPATEPATAEEATEETEVTEATEEAETAETASEATEPDEATEEKPAEAEEEYKYADEVIDFTPSEEKKRELAERKAEEERIKAEKEAEAKRKEEERAKLEAERKAATRRNNNWDDFED